MFFRRRRRSSSARALMAVGGVATALGVFMASPAAADVRSRLARLAGVGGSPSTDARTASAGDAGKVIFSNRVADATPAPLTETVGEAPSGLST